MQWAIIDRWSLSVFGRFQPPVILRLLQLGANVNAKDIYGATALHYATLHQDITRYNSNDSLVIALKHRATGTLCAFPRANFQQRNELAKTRVRGYLEFPSNSSTEDELDYLTDRMFSAEFRPVELKQVSTIPGDQIHVKSVSDILNYEAEINIKDRSGRTPLIIASALGYTDLAKFLIDRGEDMYAVDNLNISVLHEAVNSGCEPMMRLLLDCYENDGRPGEFANTRDLKRGETALHVAARTDCSPILDLLLKHGADINVVDSTGCAPLHTAVQHVHLNAVERLISAGANINQQNNTGNTPLHCAISRDKVGGRRAFATIVRMLLDHGANVLVQNFVGRSTLHRAVWFGFDDQIEVLLDAGADVNATDDYGNTPFHMIDRITVKCARVLRDRGANVNAQNVRGLTPLHLACLTLKRRVIAQLVKMGADCNIRDTFGATPLHYAICRQERFVVNSTHSHDTVIKPLLDNAADCNIRTKVGGRTALHLACMNTDIIVDIINELIIKSCSTWYDNMGNSYLHYLAEYRSEPNISGTPGSLSLCRHKNECGQTPLHVHGKAGYLHWARKIAPEHLRQDRDGLGRTFLHCYFSHRSSNDDLNVENLAREKDFVGGNCLHYVCLSDIPEFASWMKANDLMNVRDMFGRTPLFYAALYQTPDFIEQLVSAGADPNIADVDDVLPVDISLAVFAPESPTLSRVVIKRRVEQRAPQWATEVTECDETGDSLGERMYEEWLALERERSDELYKTRLQTEVKTFVNKLMAKVAELDPTSDPNRHWSAVLAKAHAPSCTMSSIS